MERVTIYSCRWLVIDIRTLSKCRWFRLSKVLVENKCKCSIPLPKVDLHIERLLIFCTWKLKILFGREERDILRWNILLSKLWAGAYFQSFPYMPNFKRNQVSFFSHQKHGHNEDSYEVAKEQLDIGIKSLTEYMKALCKKCTPTAIEMTAVISNVVHWKAPSIMNDQKIISYCKRTSHMNCSSQRSFWKLKCAFDNNKIISLHL